MKKKDRLLVTGGNSFLGKHLVSKLKIIGYDNIVVFSSKDYDLTKENEVKNLFSEKEPFQVIFHLAAVTGGVGFNSKNTAPIYYKNIMMNTLIQEYALRNNVKKFIGIGSVCEYPEFTKVPFKEKDLWLGYPEETNALYGLTKRMMLIQGKGYRQQYGFNAIHLLLANMYGPDDNFSLEASHPIPTMVKKCIAAIESGQREIVCWGDGTPTREFLYVEDAVRGILLAAKKYDSQEPVNIGVGIEVSIKDLADLIAKLTRFKGKIIWDTTKPNGQLRRCLDVSKAKKEFGFEAKIMLEEGLKKTIEWYLRNKDSLKL